jgi:predicted enzyme related to lactoylglutathione lyase
LQPKPKSKRSRAVHAGILCIAGLGLACSSGSQADVRPLVPAVAPGGTPQYRQGSFVWFDLLVDDADAVRSFYADLFGWSLEPTDDSGAYLSIRFEGRVIGGVSIADKDESTDRRALWLSSVSVSDVDRVAAAAVAAGASVILAPDELPDRGRYSVIADPQGAPIVLLRSSTGDGVRRSPEARRPGEWLWIELWTTDLQAARQFYTDLLGYEVEVRASRSAEEGDLAASSGGDDSASYLIMSRDGENRAGMMQLPFEEANPHWLPFVAVKDVYASVELVERLGGQVIVGPDVVGRHDAAIVVDPEGAVLGLQQWPRPSSPGGDR